MRLFKPENHNNNVLNSSDNNIVVNISSGDNSNIIDIGNTKATVNDTCCYHNNNTETDGILEVSNNDLCTKTNDSEIFPTNKIMTMKTVQVEPIVIRKTPKFPSRERHMAIRRKKYFPNVDELDNNTNDK